jgi:hypothetical protein
VFSPPNSAPAAAAIRIRLDEAKNDAEFSAWPSSWPSMNRFSRPAMLRIQASRMAVMSVLIAPPSRRESRPSSGW